MWDSPGSTLEKWITKEYFSRARIVGVVYDVTSQTSFSKLDGHLNQIRQTPELETALLVLIGNKADADPLERQVSTEEGQEYALKNYMFFIETSAKTEDSQVLLAKFEEAADKLQMLEQ